MFLHFLSCVIASLIPAASALPPTESPLIPKHPFVTVWNARTERCQHLDIPLDTAAFQVRMAFRSTFNNHNKNSHICPFNNSRSVIISTDIAFSICFTKLNSIVTSSRR